MKRVMITGATGIIGRALIEECVRHEVEVFVLCNPDSGRNQELYQIPQIHCFDCSLSEIAGWKQNGLQIDCFYHLAWQGTVGDARNNTQIQEANIKYSLDAVELADRLGCKTFIGTGSQAEYGCKSEKLTPDLPCNPETGYGIAKWSAGYLTKLRAKQLGMNHSWVRILSVYGPHDQTASMVMTCINCLLNHESPAMTKGEQRWDYLYSKDAARALYLLGEKETNGCYCLGSGHTRLLSEYVACIQNAVGNGVKADIGAIPYRQNQIMYLCADIQKLTDEVGFIPQYSFEQGIQETVEWVKRG